MTSVQTSNVSNGNNGSNNSLPQPNMPNVIRLVSYNQAQSAIQWWMLFCQWMNFYKMTDEQAIAAFPFYLDTIPQQWFFQLADTVKSSIARLKEAFLKRFSVKKANFDVNLFHIQQKPEESIEDYLARVYKLTNEYDVPNHLLIGITMQGLKSEIRKIVMPQKTENLEQLREAAVVAERTITSTGSISDSFAMSLHNMEERLMSNLSDKFEATLAAVSQSKFQRQHTQRDQNRPNYRQSFRNFRNDHRTGPQPIRQKCQGCGGSCTDRRQCIAKGKTCFKCKRLDHFSSVCRSGMRSQSNAQ